MPFLPSNRIYWPPLKNKRYQTSSCEEEKIQNCRFSFQARLSDIVHEKDSTISRRESAVKTMTEELIKANDIIRKLQTDIRTLNQKVVLLFSLKRLMEI